MAAIYQRVKAGILEQIEDGIYKAGDKIPSERDLSQIYGVSRMTARHGVSALVADGILKRDGGRGTYVAAKQFSQKNVRNFTETLKEQGYEPGTRVLEFSKVFNLREISQIMTLPLNTSFYKIKRLRLGNGVPIALETVYLPVEKCPDLKREDIENSLYQGLKKRGGYEIDWVETDIEACISNTVLMKLFELLKPVALLYIKSISYENNEKLYYEESYYRSDLYKYQIDIFKR